MTLRIFYKTSFLISNFYNVHPMFIHTIFYQMKFEGKSILTCMGKGQKNLWGKIIRCKKKPDRFCMRLRQKHLRGKNRCWLYLSEDGQSRKSRHNDPKFTLFLTNEPFRFLLIKKDNQNMKFHYSIQRQLVVETKNLFLCFSSRVFSKPIKIFPYIC